MTKLTSEELLVAVTELLMRLEDPKRADRILVPGGQEVVAFATDAHSLLEAVGALPGDEGHCGVFSGDHQYCMGVGGDGCCCTCDGCIAAWHET